MNNKVKGLLKNIGVFTIASFSTKILSFLAVPLYTSLLSPEEYANIDIVILLTQLVTPILSLSITDAVIRFGMDRDYDRKQVFTVGLLVVLISSLLFCAATPLWGLISEIKGKELCFVLLYFSGLLSTLLSFFARALSRLRLIVINSVLITATNLLFSYLMIARLRMGESGYYWAMIASNFIGCIYVTIAAKIWNYVSIGKNSAKTLKDMVKYSLPLSPNAVCWWINSSINRFFLNANVSKNELGLYSASTKVPNLLTIVTTTFQQAWTLSSIDSCESDKEKATNEKDLFFGEVFRLYDFLLVIITFCLICFSKLAAAILLKGEFYNGWIFIPFLALSFYFNSLNAFAGSILTALKLTRTVFYTTLVAAIINIVAAMLIIPAFGGQGAAVSMCLGYFAMWSVRLFVLKKQINFRCDIIHSVINYIALFSACMIVIGNWNNVIPLLLVLGVVLLNSQKTIRWILGKAKKKESVL